MKTEIKILGYTYDIEAYATKGSLWMHPNSPSGHASPMEDFLADCQSWVYDDCAPAGMEDILYENLPTRRAQANEWAKHIQSTIDELVEVGRVTTYEKFLKESTTEAQRLDIVRGGVCAQAKFLELPDCTYPGPLNTRLVYDKYHKDLWKIIENKAWRLDSGVTALDLIAETAEEYDDLTIETDGELKDCVVFCATRILCTDWDKRKGPSKTKKYGNEI